MYKISFKPNQLNTAMRYKEIIEAAGVGKVVKGVNTTGDVGEDELQKQAAKFGFQLAKDGNPPTVGEEKK